MKKLYVHALLLLALVAFSRSFAAEMKLAWVLKDKKVVDRVNLQEYIEVQKKFFRMSLRREYNPLGDPYALAVKDKKGIYVQFFDANDELTGESEPIEECSFRDEHPLSADYNTVYLTVMQRINGLVIRHAFRQEFVE